MPDQVKVEVRPEGIQYGDELIKLPSHEPLRELGRGANGVVILSNNKFLARQEAVKIWLRLRPRDNRDKFQQGIEEARKAVEAASEYVPLIYSAGTVADKYFFVAMEVVEGKTLREVLRGDVNTAKTRGMLAHAFLYAQIPSFVKGLLYGDPHGRNVMVRGTSEHFDVTLLDFGTSRFTSPGRFVRRHNAVLRETMLEIFDHHPLFVKRSTPPAQQVPFHHYYDVTVDILTIAKRHGTDIFADRRFWEWPDWPDLLTNRR